MAIPVVLFGRGVVFSLMVSRIGLDSQAVPRLFYKPQVRVARGLGALAGVPNKYRLERGKDGRRRSAWASP